MKVNKRLTARYSDLQLLVCYYRVMFTSWLLEQDDRDDSVGRLARLVQADYSAGCASLYKDAVAWKRHFEEKHPKKFGVLLEMLGDAYVEYSTELSEQGGAV